MSFSPSKARIPPAPEPNKAEEQKLVAEAKRKTRLSRANARGTRQTILNQVVGRLTSSSGETLGEKKKKKA